MGAKEDAEAWRALVESDPALADPPRPKVTPARAAVLGASQGMTSNFGDELGAAVDTATSKVPLLRDASQWLGTKLGGRQGQSPLTDPTKTYDQRRDEIRAMNANATADQPLAYGVGAVGGGIAQAAIPGVGALGRGANAATRLAGATASGALSGVGGSEATDVAGMAKDAAKGGGGGLAAGVVGEGVRAVAKGAAGRVEDRDYKSLGEDVREPLKRALKDQSVRVRDVLKEPAIRGALGNPGKMVQATEDGIAETGAAARQIMTGADKAAGGGMRVKDVVAPLLTLQAEMAKNSEHPAAVAALKRVITQFEEGLGSDPSQLVASTKVREFLTNQLQKPGFARGLQADPPPAQDALRRAAGVVKDSIEQHVRMALTPEAAAALQRLNDRTTAYAVIQGAAQAQVDRGAQAPSAAAKLVDFAKHHGRFGGPAAMVGGGIGAMAGGVPGAVVGSAVGAATGEAVNRTLPVIDRALAADSSQLIARGISRGGRALSSAVQGHIDSGDHKAAIEQMGQEVYGQ